MGQKEGKIKTKTDLAKKLGYTKDYVSQIIRAREIRHSKSLSDKLSTGSIIHTLSLPENEQEQVLLKIDREEITPHTEREKNFQENKVRKEPKEEQPKIVIPDYTVWNEDVGDAPIKTQISIAIILSGEITEEGLRNLLQKITTVRLSIFENSVT